VIGEKIVMPNDFYEFLTESTVADLLLPILDNADALGVSTLKAQRHLALYPSINHHQRPEIISEILCSILETEEIPFISSFKTFESLLGAVGKRDHFTHQFEVYLLGMNLLLGLSECVKKKLATTSKFREQLSQDLPSVALLWLVTSVFHDIGYPVQETASLLNEFSVLFQSYNLKILSQTLLQNNPVEGEEEAVAKEIANTLKDGIRRSLASRRGNSQAEIEIIEEIVQEITNSQNHGYIGGLLLYSIFRKSGKQWQKKIESGLPDAMSAVAMHDLKQKHAWYLSFDTNPYAYLLFLLDNLQDWGRSNASSGKFADFHLVGFHQEACTMNLYIEATHELWNKDTEKAIKKFIIDKIELLSAPNKPSTEFGFKIIINYAWNNHSSPDIEDISFEICL
jgi:hypothetical protein